jgi:hypothetical protein
MYISTINIELTAQMATFLQCGHVWEKVACIIFYLETIWATALCPGADQDAVEIWSDATPDSGAGGQLSWCCQIWWIFTYSKESIFSGSAKFQKPRCQNLPNDSEKSVLVNSSADPLCAVTGESYIEFPGWNRSHQELSRTYFPIPTLLFVVPPLRCRPLRSRRCSTNGSGANQWCRCDSWLNDDYDEPLLLISSSWMFMRCFEAGKGWLLRSLWIVHLALGDLDVHSSAVQLGDSWAHTIFRFVQKRKIGFTASAKHN